MPDEDENRRVQLLARDIADRELADVTSRLEELTTANIDLQTKLDVADAARQTAEQAKETGDKEFADFKTKTEEDAAAAERQVTRVKAMREAAGHLDDEFFTNEDRLARVKAYTDEQFEGYISDLKATAKPATGDGNQTRQTAMDGSSAAPSENGSGKAPAASAFLGGLRFAAAPGKEA